MSNSLKQRNQLSMAALTALSAVTVLGTGPAASAASLTYDANTTPPVNDGTGVWNTSTTNWFDGTNDVVWTNSLADTAVFGAGGTIANAAAGTVTVSTVNAGTIQLNPTVTTGYTLTGGTITLGSGITSTQTLTTNINSAITGSNGLAFSGINAVVGGTNTGITVSLGGANTYTGITTTGTQGRLQSNSLGALGSTAGATTTALGTDYTTVNTGGTLVVAASTNEAFLINGSGLSSAGALRINNTPTIANFIQLGSSSLILNNGGLATTFNGNIAAGTFTLSLNSFGALASNAVTFNGDITGTAATGVNINSSGNTFLFNGNKSYTGTTSVTTNSGATGVATLGGTGTLASSTVTINATATLAAAVTGGTNGTVGTLGFNNLTINGIYVADLTAASSDLLAVGGTLNLNNTAFDTLTIQGVSGAASYTLATFTTLVGTFGTVNGLPAGYTLNYNANSITLTNSSVPEPASLAGLALLGGLALRRRRPA